MSNSIRAIVNTDTEQGSQTADPQCADAKISTSNEAASIPQDLDLRIESMLMSTDHPLPAAKMAQLLGQVTIKIVHQAIEQLNQLYADTNRSFRIEQVARGWQIMTRPEFADLLAAVHKSKTASRLSGAALEALSIIAYQQPILRAQIEAIRGVASGEVIRGLMERRLVKIVGRAQEPGRPMLYGTTGLFLEVFGLASLKDLPKVEQLLDRT